VSISLLLRKAAEGRHGSREHMPCAHCPQNEMETELHFLTSCQMYDHIRDTYFPRITQTHKKIQKQIQFWSNPISIGWNTSLYYFGTFVSVMFTVNVWLFISLLLMIYFTCFGNVNICFPWPINRQERAGVYSLWKPCLRTKWKQTFL
jgi:hypothetical protein